MVGTMATSASSGGDDFELSNCFSLSRKQRLYGFAICFVTGFLLSVLGTLFLITANLTAYAIMWTVGNVCALCSTLFLMGPMAQLRRMFDKTRIWATVIYLSFMVITLVVALTVSL